MTIPLSGELAQRIIDLTSPSIPHNVNIMDATGLIIAAVDQQRVGTMHQGARVVLERGEAYRVYAADARAGIQPGVNLPFRSGNRVLGVVGVTGDPAEVEHVARVLRVTVELTVAMEADQSFAEQRRSRDRDFLARLVHDPGAVESGSLDRELGQLPAPWRLSAFVARDSVRRSASPMRLLSDIESELPTTPRRWAVFEGALWVLGGEARISDATEQRDFAAIVTPPMHQSADLGMAARTMLALVRHPYLLGERKAQWRTDELVTEALIASADARDAAVFAAPLRRANRIHRETLSAYLDANGNISDMARRVGAHRNSINRRLHSLHEVTGFDVRTSGGQVALAIARAAERRAAFEKRRG